MSTSESNNSSNAAVIGGGGNSGTNGNGNNVVNAITGEPLRIIKTQLVPHPLTTVLQRSHSPIQHQSSSTTNTTTTTTTITIPITISRPAHTPTPPSSNIIAPNSPKTVSSHQIGTQYKNAVNLTNLFSLNPVAAKINHIKTATIEQINANTNGNHGNANNISINSITMTGSGNGIIPTGTIVSSATMNAIKVGGGVNSNGGGGTNNVIMASTKSAITPIALNTSQTNTSGATSIRTIGTGGQSTQVRVVMGNLMTSSMIKQLENVAVGGGVGRTQISAFSTTPPRSLNNTSITVTRSASQYIPRASVTATPVSSVTGISSGQRLVAPIRTTPTSVTVTGGMSGGISATGNFVRGTSISRNATTSSSSVTTVISPATNTTWMATNPTGQVQLIRAIPTHQPRGQRGAAGASVVAVTGTMVTTTTTITPIINNNTQSIMQSAGVNAAVPPQSITTTTLHHTQQQGKAMMQAASSTNQHTPQTHQTYVATVLPPRQHQATLVYSSNVATTQSNVTQFSTTSATSVATAVGPRLAIASPIAATTATATVVPRQLRPIPLTKPFTTKLNTTNISIRTPNLPQLTPTNVSNVTISSSSPAVSGTGTSNPLRTTTVSGSISSGITVGVAAGAGGTATTNVIPSANLSTTRIIQLQQPNGTNTQQIIGPTGRLATNVMLPIIVNATGGNKFGIRPPVSMAAKVQPSLTITQLGIGKMPSSSPSSAATGVVATSSGPVMAQHQNLLNNGNSSSSISTTTITATNFTTNAPAQVINVSQAISGQLMTTQNIISSGGGNSGGNSGNGNTTTVVPLAIGPRGTVGNNIITGTMTPLKSTSSGGCILGGNTTTAGITVGKIMTQAQLATSLESVTNSVNSTVTPTNVFIHHTAVPQRPSSHNTSNANISVGTSSVNVNIPVSNGLSSNGSNVTTGTFLQPGSTIYYESLPANSVQASTAGVLTIATTSSTMSLGNQIVSSAAAAAAASNLSISSVPFVTHGSNNGVSGSNTSTTTFTVVPSVGGRSIGQVQIPGSTTATQIQTLPVRFSQLPLTGSSGNSSTATGSTGLSAATTVVATVADGLTVSQSLTPQLIQQTISGIDSTSQIIIPSGQQQQQKKSIVSSVSVISATTTNGIGSNGPPAQHMLIPLQTSIKMTSVGGGGNIASSGVAATVVSNYVRKRETDGSSIRAAKNLGPTFISMGSVSSGNSPIISNCNTLNTSYSLTTVSPPQTNTNTITNMNITTKNSIIIDSLSRKERISNCNNINNSANSNNSTNTHSVTLNTLGNNNINNSIVLSTTHSPSTNARSTDSPPLSDGSTTVSANSSPGIDQQIQQDNSNMVINRVVVGPSGTESHFNPINELYVNHNHPLHQAASETPHLVVRSGTPINTRNVSNSIDKQSSSTINSGNIPNVNGNSMHQTQQQHRYNGSVIDCPPRKKSRKSINESQLSAQSNQASLALPPPQPSSSSLTVTASEIMPSQSTIPANHSTITIYTANNHTANDATLLQSSSGTCTPNQTQNTLANSNAVNENLINGKENTQPVEYILKRPRNCTLLSSYNINWKSAHNHFQRYSDIKPREERKPTIMDLANQTNVLGKINGWKIYHLRTQMEDLCESESLGYDKLSNMLKQIESHGITNEIERISDLLKGNMQRSKIIVDGVNEAQNQIMKIFDHKAHISDIINRCASKRNYKKREKTY